MIQANRAYCGYVSDDNLIKNVASGGFATEIASLFLKEDGIVFGVKYTPDFYGAEFCVIDNIDEVNILSGSKYIVPNKMIQIGSDKKSVYAWAAHFLTKHKKVLFIGLGCDIGALYGYLKKNDIDDTDLYTIDLICHGPTLPSVQETCIKELESKYDSKIISFSVRYKKQGWVPPYLHAEFENGKVYNKPFYDSDFGYAFENLIRKSCYNCHFKGDNHVADLTIGDYWGISEKMEGYNKNGVSIIISRTEKGENLITQMKINTIFNVFDTDFSFAINNNPMYFRSRSVNEKFDAEQFQRDLHDKGLHYATLKQRGILKTVMIPVKRKISNMLSIETKNKMKKILRME